jgi:sulfofructose kinase
MLIDNQEGNMDRIEAIGIGSPVADLLINIDELPGPDKAARLLEVSYQFGGKVPTAMAALGRLGVRCGMVGVVGDDDEGRACIADFERGGVDASRMIVAPGIRTRFSVVLSDRKGERNFLRREEKVRTPKVSELDREYISQAKVLHLSAAGEAEREAAKWMRAAGGRVSFDADGYKPEYEEIAPLIDAFITSESYYTDHYKPLGMTLEQACRDIAARGPSTVVVTLGARGCACLTPAGMEMVPAYKVSVVDATGAGDTFHGAFIYGMLKDWSAVESARFASAVSAVKCMAIGGRAGLPTLEAVNKFIASGEIDYAAIEERKKLYQKAHGMQGK